MAKTIVITGASGFIGAHLIEAWINEPCEIYAIVRPGTRNADRVPISSKVHLIELEMKDYNLLTKYIRHADYFYHLAWEGSRLPERDDAVLQRLNYESALMAYDASLEMGCTFFMGAGSQAEYGSANGLIIENSPCNPITEYGKAKLATYNELTDRFTRDGIKFVWPRIFSLYGVYDYPGTLIMYAIDKMRKNEALDMTLCTQLWDYLCVDDAAYAMKLMALNDCASGAYNLASGVCRPLREYIEIIRNLIHSDSILNFGAISYGTAGPTNLTPSVKKIKMELGWIPKLSFEEGISIILNR